MAAKPQNLLILCEGDTESEVLKSFLDPHLGRFKDDEIALINYSGNGELKKKFKGDSERHLISKNWSVLCLVDLFEEPFGVDPSKKMSVKDRFVKVQNEMYKQIESRFHPRFGAFPVVMEIETWLLADQSEKNRLGKKNKLGVTILSPENIAHPAEYLKRIYAQKNRSYDKLSQGIPLFGEASSELVYRDNCPHFVRMIDWLKQFPPDEEKEQISTELAAWQTTLSSKYNHFLRLEENMQTEADMDNAITAWSDYDAFLQTYETLFKR